MLFKILKKYITNIQQLEQKCMHNILGGILKY